MPDLKTPIVGEYLRGQGTLIAVEDTKPPPVPPPTRDYIFEEITAHCEVRLGEQVLNKFASTWDFTGKGASVDTAIEAAKKYVEENKITPDGQLEVVAIKIVTQTRKYPTEKPSYYVVEYREFAALNYGCKRELPDDVETVVWSSRTS